MQYSKPVLTFEQQAQHLVDKGLHVSEKRALVNHLKMVNYYRLSAYWQSFLHVDSTSGRRLFVQGTTFEMIWRRYTFDRYLRLLIFDAIEYLEIAILRTRMIEQFTLLYGPFGYLDSGNFHPNLDHIRFINEIQAAIERSNDRSINSFFVRYGKESNIPLWIVAEVLSYGQLFTFFKFMYRGEKRRLSDAFDLHPPVFVSWLRTLGYIRNACAHHMRLWDRMISVRPKLPNARHHPEWHSPVKIRGERIFTILTILQYLMSYATPHVDFRSKLLALLAEYDDIPLSPMGFPENWRECALWRK